MKSVLIFIGIMLSILTGVSSTAAPKLDYTTVDKLTYRYFQEKKWDSLILIGKQALRQDIDYYYLRVRMGIAYFEKALYFPATTHLKKARQFNSSDPFIANYLYYGYLYSNKPEEAGLIKSSMTEDARNDTLLKQGVVQEVHAEGGYTFSSDRNPENLATLMGNDSIYGEQDLYGNNLYSHLGLKLRVSNRVGLSLAYEFLNFTKTKYIQYGSGETQPESITDTTRGKYYRLTSPMVVYDTGFVYQVRQHETHIGASVALSWGLKVMPALHWIRVSQPVINTGFRMESIRDTAFSNYVAALSVTKDVGIFSIGLHGSWSNLNHKKQKQVGMSLTCYPLGTLNFYGTTSATGFFQGKDKRLLLSQVLGAKITPWMWGEADFYYGNYTNANIFNGSVVYNNSDIINYRGGATLVFVVGQHLRLSLIYQYFSKESLQLYYIKIPDPGTNEIREIPQTRYNPYHTNTLIGGITWKL